jgi:hypothetical protein
MGKERPPSRRRPAKRFRDVCDTARAQIPPAKHALAPGIRTTLREASPNQPWPACEPAAPGGRRSLPARTRRALRVRALEQVRLLAGDQTVGDASERLVETPDRERACPPHRHVGTIRPMRRRKRSWLVTVVEGAPPVLENPRRPTMACPWGTLVPPAHQPPRPDRSCTWPVRRRPPHRHNRVVVQEEDEGLSLLKQGSAEGLRADS